MDWTHVISSRNVSSLTNLWGSKHSTNTVYYASSGRSKASEHKIKARLEYNPLRSQQSHLNHHYKCIERGSKYQDSNKKYAVKVVPVASSESESHISASKNIVESVKDFLPILYQFIYPYAVYGRTLAAISASLNAVQKVSDISPLFFVGLLQALLPPLFMDLYVSGVNQLFDYEIDKINKPYLPLAAGKLSFRNCTFIVASSGILGFWLNLMIGSSALIWNFVLCITLWTAYSVPFLRWKKYPVVTAILMIVSWTFIVPITYFLHMQTFVFKRPIVVPKSLVVTIAFMSLYSLGLALSKDIPDIEGDTKFGVDTFSARLGQKKVFWICVFLYEMAFGVAFLAAASSSSPFWIKIITGFGNFVLAAILWYQTKYVDVTNPASTRSFYALNWKLLNGAYVLLPFIR